MVSSNVAVTGSCNYDLLELLLLTNIFSAYIAVYRGGRIIAAAGWIRSAWLAGAAMTASCLPPPHRSSIPAKCLLGGTL